MIKVIAVCALLAATTGVTMAQNAGPSVTPYGLAQYRLRLQMHTQTPDSGSDRTAMDYANQLSFYFGAKIKVNDQVTMQFQGGNDWVTTEGVGLTTNNWWLSKGNFPYFHLAYAKYDAGIFFITIGQQPIASNGPLDLIERSLRNPANTMSYTGAGLVSWVVGTNNTMAGIKVGAPLVKGDFKLGAELFSTVITPRTQTAAEEPTSNPPATMWVLDFPISIAALTFTPQVIGILYRNYNATTEKGDHEIGAGLSASYKVMDGVAVNACGGFAQISNTNSRTAADVPDNHRGIIAGIGGSYKAGPGAAIVDFKFSNDGNTEDDSTMSSYIYVDAKYGWDINKNFQIMPRIRFFLTSYADNNASLDSKQEIRPELLITGKF